MPMSSASDYPYFKFGFTDFNPAQSKAIPYADKDVNIVASFPPGCGKTAIAEACLGWEIHNGRSFSYVCPFRALAREKADAWSKAGYETFMVSGDRDAVSPSSESVKGSKASVGVFTAESFEIATRRHPGFFDNTSCVCFDEAHMIGDPERGSVFEAGIMAAAEKARVVLLSGTLPNAREIASWLKSISGRPTVYVKTDWRPNKTAVNFHHVSSRGEIPKIRELLREYKNSKTIIFVHSKKTGKDVAAALAKDGTSYVLHNGSLPLSRRQRAERLFSNIYSGVDVIVATSTLAAGVNLE